jgi:hypothetical protein
LRTGILKKIFGPKKVEVTEGRNNSQNEDCHNLYSSLNIIRVIKLIGRVGHVARVKEIRYSYKILVGKLEGKIPLGRHCHKWGIILKWYLNTV